MELRSPASRQTARNAVLYGSSENMRQSWMSGSAAERQTTRMLASRPKPDMLFAIPRVLVVHWHLGMPDSCSGSCCIEYTHAMLAENYYAVWSQPGALARGWEHTAFPTMLTSPIPHELLHCNIVGSPSNSSSSSSSSSSSTSTSTSTSTGRSSVEEFVYPAKKKLSKLTLFKLRALQRTSTLCTSCRRCGTARCPPPYAICSRMPFAPSH